MPAEAFYPRLPVLDPATRGAPYRFAALGFTLLPNVAEQYGLEDARGYDPMTLEPLARTLPLWSVPMGPWFNRVDDPTRPFLSFLNVRWLLAPSDAPIPEGWRELAAGGGTRLLENPRVLPRAFAPRRYRGEPDPERRLELLATISDFGESGVVAESTGEGWIENGTADVAIAAYAGRRLAVTVTAREPALVATSVPAWPGWKADLDGRPVEALSFNHAFLAYRVPAGSHRLTLRYGPGSARFGLAISLAGVAACVVLLWRTRPAKPYSGSATTTV